MGAEFPKNSSCFVKILMVLNKILSHFFKDSEVAESIR